MALKPPASEVLKVALAAQTDTNIGVLASELLSAFGGPVKLARSYKLEFDVAKEGGMARQRMLEGVLRVVSQASAQQKDREQPIENLSEDELQAELLGVLTQRGVVSHSTESSPDGPRVVEQRLAS